MHLAEKGRGRALRAVWSTSDAPVLAYMDVDLSTDLAALAPLVAPLLSGHSDLAIGTRLHRGSRVVRAAKREFVSRCYNLLLRGALVARFSDAQCGFKAIRADVAAGLLPLIEDDGWFFDTELLVLAERGGLRIHEVPVDWVDDPDSRVDLVATAAADLRGIARRARALATGWLPLARLPAQLGRAPRTRDRGRAARPHPPAGALRRHRGRQHGGVLCCSTCCYAPACRAARQRVGPARLGGRQHGGQPAPHLRRPRQRAGDAAPGTGPGRLRHRPRPDQWLARRPNAATTDPAHSTELAGADRRQPRGDGAAAVPAPPGLGVRVAGPAGPAGTAPAKDRRRCLTGERTAGGRPGRMQPTGTRQEDWT